MHHLDDTLGFLLLLVLVGHQLKTCKYLIEFCHSPCITGDCCESGKEPAECRIIVDIGY